MTSVGRFSLESETTSNPSIPTFFIALAGSKPFSAQKFAQLWKDRGMEQLHPRFHHVVSKTHSGYFETSDNEELDIQDALPPMMYREDLKHRIQTCLTHPLNVEDSLWQVQISSGTLGSSGAIPGNKATLLQQEFPYFKESILLFRGHHALADGVSLTAAFGDLTDEAQELRKIIQKEVKRRMGVSSKTLLQKLQFYMKKLLWFCYGSIQATLHHLYLLLFTPNNPFDELQSLLQNDSNTGRTVSWCDAAPLEQVKQVAKSMGDKVTVNDVMVSCVTFAVARQLDVHRKKLAAIHPQHTRVQTTRSNTINVVIPVHLGGGVLLPGQSVGNNIGAFCAQVPGEETIGAKVRLERVHNSLWTAKSTPAPLLSYMFARATFVLPTSVTQRLFRSSQAHACVAVTNNRGSPRELHVDGHAIVSMAGFLPLPPGIPIGVSVTSYNGEISLSVTAEPWAVPNSDEFLKWVLEEYQRLLIMSKAESKQRLYL